MRHFYRKLIFVILMALIIVFPACSSNGILPVKGFVERAEVIEVDGDMVYVHCKDDADEIKICFKYDNFEGSIGDKIWIEYINPSQKKNVVKVKCNDWYPDNSTVAYPETFIDRNSPTVDKEPYDSGLIVVVITDIYSDCFIGNRYYSYYDNYYPDYDNDLMTFKINCKLTDEYRIRDVVEIVYRSNEAVDYDNNRYELDTDVDYVVKRNDISENFFIIE